VVNFWADLMDDTNGTIIRPHFIHGELHWSGSHSHRYRILDLISTFAEVTVPVYYGSIASRSLYVIR
jgi:hypothetical protein